MTIPIALTLISVSVAAIASIMVAVKTMECNSLKLEKEDLIKELESMTVTANMARKGNSNMFRLQTELNITSKLLEATKRKRNAKGQYVSK